MRQPARRPRNDEERVLPLINIVFLLLIFFMVAGRLAANDPFHVEPANSTSEGLPSAAPLLVLVAADGRLGLDGREVDRDALGRTVAGRIAADPSARVRLKADGRADATEVVGVMELLREAGVRKLDLLTVPEGR